MSTLEKSVEKSFEGRKIREYLKEEMGLSSRLIRGAAMDKRISVNNTPVTMNYILKEAYSSKNDNSFFIYQTALWLYMVDKGKMQGAYSPCALKKNNKIKKCLIF